MAELTITKINVRAPLDKEYFDGNLVLYKKDHCTGSDKFGGAEVANLRPELRKLLELNQSRCKYGRYIDYSELFNFYMSNRDNLLERHKQHSITAANVHDYTQQIMNDIRIQILYDIKRVSGCIFQSESTSQTDLIFLPIFLDNLKTNFIILYSAFNQTPLPANIADNKEHHDLQLRITKVITGNEKFRRSVGQFLSEVDPIIKKLEERAKPLIIRPE